MPAALSPGSNEDPDLELFMNGEISKPRVEHKSDSIVLYKQESLELEIAVGLLTSLFDSAAQELQLRRELRGAQVSPWEGLAEGCI